MTTAGSQGPRETAASCEHRADPQVCCAVSGYAEACVHAGRLTVAPSEARAFDDCWSAEQELAQWHHPSTCWPALPARAYDEARAICAVGGTSWCDYLEDLRDQRASGLTLAIAAAIATAAALTLLRSAKLRLGPSAT